MSEVMYWSELAELTHATQVEKFGWCACEDQGTLTYTDCPVGNCSNCYSWCDALENGICQTCIKEKK